MGIPQIPSDDARDGETGPGGLAAAFVGQDDSFAARTDASLSGKHAVLHLEDAVEPKRARAQLERKREGYAGAFAKRGKRLQGKEISIARGESAGADEEAESFLLSPGPEEAGSLGKPALGSHAKSSTEERRRKIAESVDGLSSKLLAKPVAGRHSQALEQPVQGKHGPVSAQPAEKAGSGKHSQPLGQPAANKAQGKHSANLPAQSPAQQPLGKHHPDAVREKPAEAEEAKPLGAHAGEEKADESKEGTTPHRHIALGSLERASDKNHRVALKASAILLALALLAAGVLLVVSTCTGGESGTGGVAAVDTQESEATESSIEAHSNIVSQNPVESGAPSGSIEAELDEYGYYPVSVQDLQNLQGGSGPFAFALDGQDSSKPQLSDASLKALQQAGEKAGADGAQVGYLLVDLNSGRGIACNLDERVYGASSWKGVFCTYLCEASDTSGLNIDTIQPSIDAIIRSSDNDSYDILRMSFGTADFAAWLDSIGLEGDGELSVDWYPFITPRSAGIAWLHMDDYLNSGAAHAAWLDELFGSTGVSFIRDGIASSDVHVRNKAGWYAETWEDGANGWNGTCDSGLVQCNGHTYLVSVLTGQPTNDAATQSTEELVHALWEARADLA